MYYGISFLDGIATFLKPDMLPLLGVYALACLDSQNRSNRQSLIRGFGFAAGFVAVYVLSFGMYIPDGLCTAARTAALILPGLVYILGREDSCPAALLSGILGAGFGLHWYESYGFFPMELSMGRVLLLAVSGLGMAIPYVFCGVFLDCLKREVYWLWEHRKILGRISGIALLAAGVILLF